MTVHVHLLKPVDSTADVAPGATARRRLRWGRWVSLAVLLLLIGVVAARRAGLIGAAAVSVGVHRVARGVVEESLANSTAGTVRAAHRAALSPEVAGRVVAIPAAEGQAVRRGDVLLRLSDQEATAQAAVQRRLWTAARAEVRRACALADRADADHARIRQLAAEQLVPRSELEAAAADRAATLAACEAARAHASQAAASVDAADVVLRRCVLKAPFDGVVADVHVALGEWVTPSPPGLRLPPAIELLDPRSVYVRAPLDEVDEAHARVGLPVRVSFDAWPGRTFAGRVTRVAPYVSDEKEEGRTVDVDVSLDAPLPTGLRAGTSADVEVIVQTRADVLRIPTNALIDDRYVLVVVNDRLERRPIRLGLRNWAYVEVVAGLDAGAAVVVTLDRPGVVAGARVRVEAEPRS